MNFSVDDGLINTEPDPNLRTFDEVATEIFKKYGMPTLGGASGRGWSSFATFQRCPRLTYLQRRVKFSPPRAMQVGSAFHTLLALHYTWMRDQEIGLTPQELYEELLNSQVDPLVPIEAWRLYQAYEIQYAADYLTPLAIEEWAIEPNGFTCRYDLIARVDVPNMEAITGTWIVETKTSARFDDATLDGWRNDGEVFGEMMVWRNAGLSEKYGELRGVIVNIVGKQKLPKFHRTIVSAQSWQTDCHLDDLKIWAALQQMCEATGVWPQARANCISRYGKCAMFDLCAENRSPPELP